MSSQSCEKIKVYGRIRPSKEDHLHKVVNFDRNGFTVDLDGDVKSFQFDGTFGEDSTQEEVFEGAAARIVDGTLQGYNGTIFAYGQTGSGKTHTMIGPTSKFDHNSGIIPRGLHTLFDQLDKKSEQMSDNFSFKIAVSFVEIYNEAIYDLFGISEEKLRIGQDRDGNAIVKGTTEIFVKDLSDAMEEVRRGWNNRSVAETAMNRSSSRSHALLLIKIRTEEVHGSISTARSAFLNLVDLAGSERVSQSKVEGERLKETAHINTSLLTLKKVIRELTEQNKYGFISFRSSVLTHILKDSLGGNARTAVMINVHPDKKYYSETLATLQFAAEVRRIENKVVMNEDLKGDSVLAYQNEIKRLQIEVETIKDKSAEELAEKQSSLERWKEAATRFERQLAVARRNAVNAAIIARKEGYGASEAESLWEKSMMEVDESVRDLPTTGIRSLQLRELTEQLNLCTFEKEELVSQLNVARKEKGELKEKLNRYMEGVLSPIRDRRTKIDSSSSQEESIGSSMTSNVPESSFATPAAAKKDRRRTRYEKPNERKSTFFRPVLDVDGDDAIVFKTPVETDNSEEIREMDLEMKLNQKEQIIDEKMRECDQLSGMLKEAEERISVAEAKMVDAIKLCADEKKKVEGMNEELAEDRKKLMGLEKQEADLNEKFIEATSQIDTLTSDIALIKSTHIDEMKELEIRLKTNLTDKEKKEVDLNAELDRLKEDISNKNITIENIRTEQQAGEEVMKLLTASLQKMEEDKNCRTIELESLTSQMVELRHTLENEKQEGEKTRKKIMEGHKKEMIEVEEYLKEKNIEMEEMRKNGEMSSVEIGNLQNELDHLRISNRQVLCEKIAEKDRDIEHWKTVSAQFASKMEEMKMEFNYEKDKRLEVEAREKRTLEALNVRVSENGELKENLSALGSHANNKQKLHIMSRYVEEKRVLQQRVNQLESVLKKHGLSPLHPTDDDWNVLERGENGGAEPRDGDVNRENEMASTSRRRVVSSTSTDQSAISGRTRSTRTAGVARK